MQARTSLFVVLFLCQLLITCNNFFLQVWLFLLDFFLPLQHISNSEGLPENTSQQISAGWARACVFSSHSRLRSCSTSHLN